MKSVQDYAHEIDEYGLSRIKIEASNVAEGRDGLGRIREIQKQLRQIKRDINLDMKGIRAEYRHRSSTAASGSSAVFELLGQRKAAGQMRAEAKRQLRSERDQELEPYEQLKLAIDDLLVQLDGAKSQLQTFIDDKKAEEQAAKEAIEEVLDTLRRVHLATTPPDTIFTVEAESFSVPPPAQPPSTFRYTTPKPTMPALKQIGLMDRLSKKRQSQVEADNQLAMAQYEQSLDEWEAGKRIAEENFNAARETFGTQLRQWEEAKAQFEQAEEMRVQELQQARLSDRSTMESLLSSHLDAIEWPLELLVSAQSTDDNKALILDVELPAIDAWPVKQQSVVQKRRDYLTHIHSVAFRLVGEAFFILPSIEQVVLSGYVKMPSKTTGQLEKAHLLSVRVWRKAWERINFERLDWIDVVECLGEFEVRRKFTKTAIISPIEPLEVAEPAS